jgi:hypothetical protein
MSEEQNNNQVAAVDVENLTSVSSFKNNYEKILIELDALAKGVYDEGEAVQTAALCLLAESGLIKILAQAEQRSRGLKRDIDFAKSDAFYNLMQIKIDGKKVAATAVPNLVSKDEKVTELYQEYNMAEKEARELANLLNILKDAHITFRMLVKRGGQ